MWSTDAPAPSQASAVSTNSCNVTGRAGNSAFDTSAPVGATAIMVAAVTIPTLRLGGGNNDGGQGGGDRQGWLQDHRCRGAGVRFRSADHPSLEGIGPAPIADPIERGP